MIQRPLALLDQCRCLPLGLFRFPVTAVFTQPFGLNPQRLNGILLNLAFLVVSALYRSPLGKNSLA
jgi:hypothetical protein